MTARRKPNNQPQRTRRVLAGAPVAADIAPAVQKQEGEFVSVAISPSAANDASDSRGNVPMALCTVVFLLGVAIMAALTVAGVVKGYGLFNANVPPLLRLFLAFVAVGALASALSTRINNRRSGVSA